MFGGSIPKSRTSSAVSGVYANGKKYSIRPAVALDEHSLAGLETALSAAGGKGTETTKDGTRSFRDSCDIHPAEATAVIDGIAREEVGIPDDGGSSDAGETVETPKPRGRKRNVPTPAPETSGTA